MWMSVKKFPYHCDMLEYDPIHLIISVQIKAPHTDVCTMLEHSSNTILVLNMKIKQLKMIKCLFNVVYLTCGDEDDEDEGSPRGVGYLELHWWWLQELNTGNQVSYKRGTHLQLISTWAGRSRRQRQWGQVGDEVKKACCACAACAHKLELCSKEQTSMKHSFYVQTNIKTLSEGCTDLTY